MNKLHKKWVASVLSLSLVLSTGLPAQAFGATDINGHWAQSTINKWVNNGYINGYPDGTFRPDKAISRAEFVVLVNQAFQVSGAQSIFFNDVDSTDWYYSAVQKAVARGYVKGDANGNFRPGSMVTRQEAAVMIAQIKGLGENTPAASATYTDAGNIPAWSKGYVGAVTQSKIMSGFPDGTFKPNASMTRAEAITALDKALSASTYTNQPSTYTPPSTNTTGSSGNTNTSSSTTKTTSADDVTLNKGDTSLKDKIIKGDLILSKDLGTDSVRLEDVEVQGDLIVYGAKKITLEDCKIHTVFMDREDADLIGNGSTTVQEVIFKENGRVSGKGFKTITISDKNANDVIIAAECEFVYLDTDAKLKLYADADISNLKISDNTDGTTVTFSRGSEVDDMEIHDDIKITGYGDIRTMTVYVSGVRSAIEPDSVRTKDGASKPRYIKNSSSSSGSSNSSHNSDYDDLTVDESGTTSGGKYEDVMVTEDGARVKNMTIYGDLTISSKVKDGTVTLTNLDIRGNVYVYGGGDHSVIFNECEIDGDVVSDKTYNDEAVALEFDNDTTVDGAVRILEDTIIKSSGNDVKLGTIDIESSNIDVEIRVDVKKINVSGKAKILFSEGAQIETLAILSGAKDTVITLDDKDVKIDKMVARVAAEVKGKGTVDTIDAYADVQVGSDVTNDHYGKPDGTTVPVTGIALSQKTAMVAAGGQTTLTATVQPANATNKQVSWESSDPSAATVSNGVVTGVKAGATATITAKTQDGAKTDACVVTVVAPGEVVTVEDVKVSASTITVGVNKTKQLSAAILPSNATDKSVTWKSEDTSVATVTADGLVTGLKDGGQTNIVVTTNDGGKTASCIVKVAADAVEDPDDETSTVVVNSIKISAPNNQTVLNKDDATDKTLQLTATVDPAGTKVNWKSDSNGVATVDANGLVTAVAAGQAQITAMAGANKKVDSYNITVIANTTGIKMESTKLALNTGNKGTLTAIVTPGYGNNLDVYFSSSDKNIVQVDDTLEEVKVTAAPGSSVATAKASLPVKAVAPGDAVVTAAIKDKTTGNIIYSATCAVNVSNAPVPVTGVTVEPSTLEIKVGDTAKLTAAVQPETALQNVTWESQNEANVSVDEEGNIEALHSGPSEITAWANANYYGTCKVTVVDDRKITIERVGEGDIKPGDSLEFKITMENLSEYVPDRDLKIQWNEGHTPVVTDSQKLEKITPNQAKLTFQLRSDIKGSYFFKAMVDTGRYGEVNSGTTKNPWTQFDVMIPVESITFDKEELVLSKSGGAQSVTYTVLPSAATSKTLKWEIEDETIAKVDAGKVTPIKAGDTILTATSVSNPEVKATMKISVTDYSTIRIFPTTSTTILGGTGQQTIDFVIATYNIKEDLSNPTIIKPEFVWENEKMPYSGSGNFSVVPSAGDKSNEFELRATITNPIPGTYSFRMKIWGITSETVIYLTVEESGRSLLTSVLPQSAYTVIPEPSKKNIDDEDEDDRDRRYQNKYNAEEYEEDSKHGTRYYAEEY